MSRPASTALRVARQAYFAAQAAGLSPQDCWAAARMMAADQWSPALKSSLSRAVRGPGSGRRNYRQSPAERALDHLLRRMRSELTQTRKIAREEIARITAEPLAIPNREILEMWLRAAAGNLDAPPLLRQCYPVGPVRTTGPDLTVSQADWACAIDAPAAARDSILRPLRLWWAEKLDAIRDATRIAAEALIHSAPPATRPILWERLMEALPEPACPTPAVTAWMPDRPLTAAEQAAIVDLDADEDEDERESEADQPESIAQARSHTSGSRWTTDYARCR